MTWPLFFCMQLREALEVINGATGDTAFPVLLACGFTPLHLRTFLGAHLQRRRSADRVEVRTGLYDDFLGTLNTATDPALQGVLAVMEWTDLDPRLGLRQLGGWSPDTVNEITDSACLKLALVEELLERIASHSPLVLCGPLLDLPPCFYSPRRQLHPQAARLTASVAAAMARLTTAGARVLDASRLPSPRFDVRSYLANGFPYRADFASALGHQLAEMLLPPPPKKGLITDLDDTLWRGILGEAGPQNVSWDLNGKSQIHGIYQTLLQSLAGAGALVAVASKNDPRNVEEAFARPDLLVSAASVFPIEAGWGAKSDAVARILQAWNISADDVVFVDDSPMELAEVASAFPSITTLRFPADDVEAAWGVIGELRDYFGKTQLSEEDRLRTQSLRGEAERRENLESSGGRLDDFLARSEAAVTIEPVEPGDTRAFELINKTNQFNLNGERRTEQDWRRMLADPNGVTRVISYEDKYGRLGKIAVFSGEHRDGTIRLHTWVMSCRAFSRRIEHQCLRWLFEEYKADRIELDFKATKKNGPLQEFLTGLNASEGRLGRAEFEARCPALFHTVRDTTLIHE